MTAKLILDGERVVFQDDNGGVRIQPGKKQYDADEVEALMQELRRQEDEPSG